MWRSVIRRRVGRFSPYEGLTDYEGFSNLFDINEEKKYLGYKIQENEKWTKVSLFADTIEEEMTGRAYRNILNKYFGEDQENEMFDSIYLLSGLDIEIVIDEKSVNQFRMYDAEEIVKLSPRKMDNSKHTKNVIYISPSYHTERYNYLQNILDNPELYEEILDILREYDEGIISINYSNHSKTRRGVYQILSKSHQKALPLNVYGDGMKKALSLISAAVMAQNGILLLDEFETAIHTSAMEQTFRWILETCKKLNVQVFMTSHSKEAIDKVLKCAPELMEDIAVYTMYKENEEISVRRLGAKKAIEVQDEMGLELR